MPGPARDEHNESSRLADLLACEQELEALRTRAREEAAELVACARRDADGRSAAQEAALESEIEALRLRIREESHREVARARAQAETLAGRYDAIDDAEVERLCEVAFRELLRRSGP